MTKVLTFLVGINEIEDKIWRKIEITDNKTVADLAYTILATFNSLAYHLYNINYKGNVYECYIDEEDDLSEIAPIDATITKLKELKLEENDVMEMEYDFGSPTTFKITFLKSEDLEKGKGKHYPYIIEGAGKGMLDDMCDFELKRIVEDIDKKGYSEHNFTPGYEIERKYDYREFDIELNNYVLKSIVKRIKNGYEE